MKLTKKSCNADMMKQILTAFIQTISRHQARNYKNLLME